MRPSREARAMHLIKKIDLDSLFNQQSHLDDEIKKITNWHRINMKTVNSMFFVNFHQITCTFYSFDNWSFAIISINDFNKHYIFIIFSFIMYINSKCIWSHSISIHVLHILRHNYIYFYKNKKSMFFTIMLFNHVKSFTKKKYKIFI